MTNLPTLEGFIAFAKAKPKAEAYDYGSVGSCAFAQYIASINPEVRVIVGSSSYDIGKATYTMPHAWDRASGGQNERTFGALAARLELLTLTARETGFPPQDAGFTS